MPEDLTVIPVGLSPQAMDFLIELLDDEAHTDHGTEDGDFAAKLAAELRVARNAPVKPRREDDYDATDRAFAEVEREQSDAERIAGKMAKAAKETVDNRAEEFEAHERQHHGEE